MSQGALVLIFLQKLAKMFYLENVGAAGKAFWYLVRRRKHALVGEQSTLQVYFQLSLTAI